MHCFASPILRVSRVRLWVLQVGTQIAEWNLSLLSTGVNAGGWAFAAFSTNITAEWAGRFRDYSTADGC